MAKFGMRKEPTAEEIAKYRSEATQRDADKPPAFVEALASLSVGEARADAGAAEVCTLSLPGCNLAVPGCTKRSPWVQLSGAWVY
jgi:hypothetical protein